MRNDNDSNNYSNAGLKIAPLLVAVGMGLWTVSSALFGQALVPISPLSQFAAVLLVTLLPCAILVFKRRHELFQLRSTGWLALIAGSWCGPLLGMLCFMYAAAGRNNMTGAVFVQELQPLIVMVMAYISLRERPSPRVWLAIALAIFGSYFLSFGFTRISNQVGTFDTTPVAYGILATTLGALSTVCNRAVVTKLSASTLTSLRLVISAALAVPLALLLEPSDFKYATFVGSLGEGWLWFVFVSLVTTILGSLFYYRGLKETAAVGAAIAESSVPIIFYIISWVDVRAIVSGGQFLGIGMILLAIFIVQPSDLSRSAVSLRRFR